MTVLSPRLLLTEPDENQFMLNGDNILAANYDIIDLNAHQRIVATTAAVATPYEGQSIYATTPAENYVRKYGAWVKTNGAPPGFSGGPRGFSAKAGNDLYVFFTTSGSDVLFYSATFTVENGRRYLIEYHFNATKDSTVAPPSTQGNPLRINFRRNFGGSVNNTHLQIGTSKTYHIFTSLDSTGTAAGHTGDGLTGFMEWVADGTGTVTIGMFVFSSSTDDWHINQINLAAGNPGWHDSHFHVTDWDSA